MPYVGREANSFTTVVDVTVSDDLTVTDDATIGGALSAKGGAVFNEDSADVDFRVETNANANAFKIDGGNNTVTVDSPLTASLARSNTVGGCALIIHPNDTTVSFGFRIDQNTNSLNIDRVNTTTNIMAFSASGEITMPQQPAFSVKTAVYQNNLSTDSDITVIWGTETFDVNADFASNTFTAPVTGKYQFNIAIRLDNYDQTATYAMIKVVTSNRTYNLVILDPDVFDQDAPFWTMSGSVLADMDASDTATIAIRQSGGAAQMDVSTDSFWTGFLAC
jgi:hypothetical protein